ncbi:alpha/beta fold hydrolase [Agrobacterium larrymoorei]|uniref:alpha/beta fold hydrolase n=1 Tax=Agrobacterium larrymoorei TaxID=160699 RepID=UPI00157349F5|nr:alpha/beta fold hydrolase [Agrobacterium larrymoorei]NTJ44796.1 alpha/beta fold hydrolase [Agrobacterium larrymoorei]
MNMGFAMADKSRKAAQAAADHPVTFAGTTGLYRPGDIMSYRSTSGTNSRDFAVLFVSSWGFEELCARKFWRLLAADLSKQGIASLRFDYPGTGDALDPVDYEGGLDVWLDSIGAAAAKLREISGASKLILIGHGIGGALAWKAAETLHGVEGLALAATAISGRNWLREFVAMSRIANQGAIQHREPNCCGPAMGEQVIPESVAAGLRAINISKVTAAPASNIFILKQENRPADAMFAEHLAALDIKLRSEIFEGYDRFVRDVMFSVPPKKAISALVDWCADVAVRDKGETTVPDFVLGDVVVPEAGRLHGDGFFEEPIRFGDADRLYGIVCQPEAERKGATVLVVSTGYDRMAGWGRITTRLCRELARNGIASLRFDMANIADSPPEADAPAQIIYNKCQLRDVEAAMDFLQEKQLFPVVITGRCSGGWVAFRSAVNDPRFSGVVPVNVFDFYIPADADVEALLISSRQPLSSYGAKLMSGCFWKRVLSGEVRVKNGIVNMWAMIVGKAISLTTPVMVQFPFLTKRFHSVSQDFRKIVANDTKMTVVYTEGDVGAAMLETNFGTRGHLMTKRYGNPRIVFIEGADHNLTTAEARHAWSDEVKKIALQFTPKGRTD